MGIEGVDVGLEQYRTFVNPARLQLLELVGAPLVYIRAAGSWLEDRAGRRYLDFVGGYGTAVLGHRHPKVMQALADAVLDSEGAFNYPMMVPAAAGALAAKLCEVAGCGLSKVYFGNSGTEGVEAALKFAMATTGRAEFVSFSEGYHGMTLGALSLAGADFMQAPFPAQGVPVHRVPFGDLAAVEACLAANSVAGVVIEVIQGMGGGRTWPIADLQKLSALCRHYGAVVILDEVLSGIGRCGEWFAFQRVSTDFAPDIVVTSKGLTGGAVPMCAVLMTERVYTAVYEGIGRANIHTSTFEANLLAITAGLSVLKVIESEDLLAKAKTLQQQFRARLNACQAEYGMIEDVRGLGAFVSFAVADAFDKDQEIWGAPALQQRLRQQGVLCNIAVQAPTYINLMPPLTLLDEEVDYFFAQLNDVFVSTNSIGV